MACTDQVPYSIGLANPKYLLFWYRFYRLIPSIQSESPIELRLHLDWFGIERTKTVHGLTMPLYELTKSIARLARRIENTFCFGISLTDWFQLNWTWLRFNWYLIDIQLTLPLHGLTKSMSRLAWPIQNSIGIPNWTLVNIQLGHGNASNWTLVNIQLGRVNASNWTLIKSQLGRVNASNWHLSVNPMDCNQSNGFFFFFLFFPTGSGSQDGKSSAAFQKQRTQGRTPSSVSIH